MLESRNLECAALLNPGRIDSDMDPYLILGIAKGCSREQAKEAFRALVHSAHPDRGGNAEAFVQLCNAYRLILEESGRADGTISESSAVPPQGQAQPASRDAGATRENYVLWLRQVSRAPRRRRRVHWWTRHPRIARGILLAMIVFSGVLIVVITWLFAPGMNSSSRSRRSR